MCHNRVNCHRRCWDKRGHGWRHTDGKHRFGDAEAIDCKKLHSESEIPFEIEHVSGPRSVRVNAPPKDLDIYYLGTPRFPVKMSFYPVPPCPAEGSAEINYVCHPVEMTFERPEPGTYEWGRKLVAKGVCWCKGNIPGPVYTNYDMVLIDADGNMTEPHPVSGECVP
jgi:hypothetical protein